MTLTTSSNNAAFFQEKKAAPLETPRLQKLRKDRVDAGDMLLIMNGSLNCLNERICSITADTNATEIKLRNLQKTPRYNAAWTMDYYLLNLDLDILRESKAEFDTEKERTLAVIEFVKATIRRVDEAINTLISQEAYSSSTVSSVPLNPA